MKQDLVRLDEAIVVDAAWPGVEEAARVYLEGRSGVVAGESLTLLLPPTPRPLAEYNQMVLDLYLARDQSLILSLQTDYTPPGFTVPDRLVAVVETEKSGWRRLAFSLDSFNYFGRSNDFSRVKRLVVEASPSRGQQFGVGDLRMRMVEPPSGPRLTDQEFLAELDLTRPGLAEVRRAWSDGDSQAALAALECYFRRRAWPEHDYLERVPPATPEVIVQADRICEGWIRCVGQDCHFPDGIDWRASPTGYQEWNIHLHYMSWTQPLIAAYKATGDQKYAACQDRIISSYIRDNPRPLDHAGGTWQPHKPASRMSNCWPLTFFAMLKAEEFLPRTRVEMLKSWWEMVEHTLLWSLPYRENKRFSDSRAITVAGILLPEFKRASLWRKEGLSRLTGDMARQIHEDGVHRELAGYHEGILNSLCTVYRLASLNRIRLDDKFIQVIKRMLDWTIHRMRPNGTIYSHNDQGGYNCSRRPGHGGFSSGYDVTAIVAEELGREDYKFLRDPRGPAPKQTSRAFPDAGFHIFRSGWHPDDLCLFFDGASFGAGHQHEDKLSIDLSGFGREFVVDPGVNSYMFDQFRKYALSSWGHSTIQVDGRGQNRRQRQSPEQWRRGVGGENEWYSGEGLEYAKSQYTAGYGEPEPGEIAQPVHHRAVLFVGKEYFLVFDWLEGKGRHQIESLLTFSPMPVLIERQQLTFRTYDSGGPSLEVICLAGPPAPDLSLRCAETDPPLGWVAHGHGKPLAPAPVGVLTWRCELPLLAGLLLKPSPDSLSAGLSVEPVRFSETAWTGRVNWPDGRLDWIGISFAGDIDLAMPGIESSARVAVVRARANGELVTVDQFAAASNLPS